MRLFWGLIAVIVLAAAGWFAYSQAQARRAAEQAARAQADAEIASDFAQRQQAVEAERIAAQQRAAESASSSTPPPSPTPAANGATPSRTTLTGEPASAVPSTVATVPAPAPAAAQRPETTATAAGTADVTQVDAPAGSSELPPKIGDFTVRQITIERKPDGTIVLAGSLTIKGEGTEEKPYDVPWDALTAAEQTLDPRAGRKEIPGVTAFLHGKHVKLRGYVSFPLMIKEPRECLAMLNPWDGCCIGVPPTPYDAVEVALASPVTGNTRYATTGSVTGVFEVKPYLMGDWLVGLYVMSGGKLEPTDYGGPAGS